MHLFAHALVITLPTNNQNQTSRPTNARSFARRVEPWWEGARDNGDWGRQRKVTGAHEGLDQQGGGGDRLRQREQTHTHASLGSGRGVGIEWKAEKLLFFIFYLFTLGGGQRLLRLALYTREYGIQVLRMIRSGIGRHKPLFETERVDRT